MQTLLVVLPGADKRVREETQAGSVAGLLAWAREAPALNLAFVPGMSKKGSAEKRLRRWLAELILKVHNVLTRKEAWVRAGRGHKVQEKTTSFLLWSLRPI